MTKEQAQAEIRYRLAKYTLYCLRDQGLITPEEAENARRVLCEKYKPFTYSLEVDLPWQDGR